MKNRLPISTRSMLLIASFFALGLWIFFAISPKDKVLAASGVVANDRSQETQAPQQGTLLCPNLISKQIAHTAASWEIQLDYDLFEQLDIANAPFNLLSGGRTYNQGNYNITTQYLPVKEYSVSYLFDIENVFLVADEGNREKLGAYWNDLTTELRLIASPGNFSVHCNCSCTELDDRFMPSISDSDKFIDKLYCASKDSSSGKATSVGKYNEITRNGLYNRRVIIRGQQSDERELDDMPPSNIENWSHRLAQTYDSAFETGSQTQRKAFDSTVLVIATQEKSNVDPDKLGKELQKILGERANVLMWPFADPEMRKSSAVILRGMLENTPQLRINLSLSKTMDAEQFENLEFVWKIGKECHGENTKLLKYYKDNKGEVEMVLNLNEMIDPLDKPRDPSLIEVHIRIFVAFLITVFLVMVCLLFSLLAYRRDWWKMRTNLNKLWEFPWSPQ